MMLAPGSKLGPYEILARIGSGGMGEVWKARDTRLGRIVAIKTAKEQHSERFKQEARTIAALNHPFICQLFDIGPDYLVLEYVEGKTLRSPLPEREAVRLAIQIATALEAAHKKGIIHRDLKPANIMVTEEGSVKLLDFGLAKLYEQDAASSQLPTADFPATQAGAVLGTAAYMSPEQAQGQPADARSDVFSFGLVLYEMLSGRKPFPGETPPAIMAALLRDEPPSLQASSPLQKIVRHCLAKQPSARYQTVSEVKTALEQIFGEKTSGSSAETQPSIAVLPFVDMSPGKDNEWFGDGLAEEIINALTHIPELLVISRTSAFAFKGKQEDITRIAEALRVKTVLEGSVRKAGNRIRVTAQLIDASRGSHLWSERYDREMTDVFAIQDEISQAIAEKLRVRLVGIRPIVKRYTENIEAYSLYLKGRYHLLKFTLQGAAKSKEYYEQALAADPSYALAWAGLAHVYQVLGFSGLMFPKDANAQSSQAAPKALELYKALAEAHSMIAVLHAGRFDWKGAEREFHRALELNPESEDILGEYCIFYLVPMRRLAEALAAWQRLVEVDPLSPFRRRVLGYLSFLMRQYHSAVEQCNNALELDPAYLPVHIHLGQIYIAMGSLDEAIRILETAKQTLEYSPIVVQLLGFAYAQAGRTGEAQKLVEELQGLAEKAYVPSVAFAFICLGLGEIDKAFDSFERAIEESDSFIFEFNVSPLYDPLRSHPRYHALLRKINLEPETCNLQPRHWGSASAKIL